MKKIYFSKGGIYEEKDYMDVFHLRMFAIFPG
jgi:hypothetical protein